MRSDSAFLKRFETGFAFLLVLAGFFSALHGVNDLGSTMDEGHFLNCGLKFLTTGDFHHGTDHPPFSMWFGALAPWIKGHLTPDTIGIQLARIPHVILYGLVGFVGTALFALRAGQSWTALLFAALWALSPGLKAAVSLHTTDGDATVLMTLASIALYTAPALTPVLAFTVFLIFWFACAAKISASLLGPALVLVAVLKPRKNPFLMSLGAGLAAFALAFSVTYFFSWKQMFELYPEAYKALARHQVNGHPGSMLSNLFVWHVWYYFPVTFFSKTPIPILILMGWALVRHFQRPIRQWKVGFFLFALPGLIWFWLAVRGNIQIGYRHIVPAVTLVSIFAALELGRLHSWRAKTIVLLLVLVAVAGDWSTLRKSTYLAYFNEAAPWPSTRNFVDSNNDWNQGVPRHLESELRGAIRIPDTQPLFFLRSPPGSRARWLVGATELASLWPWSSALAPVLRAFRPEQRIAGYEVFDLGQEDIFAAMLERQPVFRDVGKELHRLDQELLRPQPLHECGAGHHAVLKNLRLLTPQTRVTVDDEPQPKSKKPLQVQEILNGTPDHPAAARVITGEVELLLPPITHGLAVLSSNTAFDLRLDSVTTVRTHQNGRREYPLHWLPLNLEVPVPRARFRMDPRGVDPASRTLDLGVFWWDCVPL